MTARTSTDLDDLFRGLVFYGTGGGGRAASGLALLRAHFDAGWMPHFTDPATLPPEALACATIVLGGRDPDEDVSAVERRALGLPETDLPMGQRFACSVRALERSTGTHVTALAVVELGSLAMAATLIAADLLDKVVLDCDCTGRSIPELGMSKMDLVGASPAPAAMVDRFGGETVLLRAPSAAMADRLARQISHAVWGRGLACTGYLQPVSGFLRGTVSGSVAAAARAGALLGGSAPPSERLQAFLAATGGRVMFEGIAGPTKWRSQKPYQFRELDYHLDGSGPDAGRRLRVWVKNEHHMVWRDEILVASSPNPIGVLDAATLDPLTTLGDVTPGRAVLVVATSALDPIWATAPGIALLGPKRFGFDTDVA